MGNENKVIGSIRSFNRFYTPIIGVLGQYMPGSNFSLVEIRVIWEIGFSGECTARKLIKQLDIDTGYLSRIIKRLEKEGLLSRERSDSDGRIHILSLTAAGEKVRKVFEELADKKITALVSGLTLREQKKVVESMTVIQAILSKGFNKC